MQLALLGPWPPEDNLLLPAAGGVALSAKVMDVRKAELRLWAFSFQR